MGGLAVATTAVTAFGVSSFNAFTDFQTGMNEVFTLLPGITETAMSGMESSVQRFMNTSGRVSEETLPALYQALSAGVPQDNVFDFLELAHQAAMGGVTDLETAVDGISSVVNAYGEDVISATQTSDLMFTAVRLGKTTFDELASSLFQVVPVASAMGVGFEDITAGLATITAQGVPTSVATTQMRQLFVELGDSASVVGGIFEDVAGQSFSDFIAGGNSTADAMRLIEQASIDSGVPLQQMFGSIEAAGAALALTGTNMETFADNTEAMGDSAGATQAAYEIMAGGIQNSINLFTARFQSAMISTGRIIAPFVKPLIDIFSVLFAIFEAGVAGGETLSDWLGHLPTFLRPVGFAVAQVGAFLFNASNAMSNFVTNLEAGVDPIFALAVGIQSGFGGDTADSFLDIVFSFRQFITMVSTAVAPITTFLSEFVTMKDVMIGLGIALASVIIPAVVSFAIAMAVPLAIFGALVLAVAGLRTVWETNFLGIRDVVNDLWQNTLVPAFEAFTNFITGLWDAFSAGGLAGASAFINDSIVQPILTALTSIDWSAVGTGIMDAIGNALGIAVDFVVWFVDNIYNPMLLNAQTALASVDWFSVGEGVMNAIGTAIVAVFDFVVWITDSIFNPIAEDAETATEGVDWIGIGTSLLNAIGSALTTAFNFVLWLSTNVFLPMVGGAIVAIASVDWGGLGTGIMTAIGEALPDILAWVNTHIIDPIKTALANFNPMEAVNTTGNSVNQLGAIGNQISSGNVTFGQVAGIFGNEFNNAFGSRQFGGRVRKGIPTIVGDGGSPNSRELFIPDQDGSIVPNAQTEEALSGGGGEGIVIHFNFSNPITQDDANESAYMLTNSLRAEGVPI